MSVRCGRRSNRTDDGAGPSGSRGRSRSRAFALVLGATALSVAVSCAKASQSTLPSALGNDASLVVDDATGCWDVVSSGESLLADTLRYCDPTGPRSPDAESAANFGVPLGHLIDPPGYVLVLFADDVSIDGTPSVPVGQYFAQVVSEDASSVAVRLADRLTATCHWDKEFSDFSCPRMNVFEPA